MSHQRILNEVDTQDVRLVRFLYCDNGGVIRGKLVPRSRLGHKGLRPGRTADAVIAEPVARWLDVNRHRRHYPPRFAAAESIPNMGP